MWPSTRAPGDCTTNSSAGVTAAPPGGRRLQRLLNLGPSCESRYPWHLAAAPAHGQCAAEPGRRQCCSLWSPPVGSVPPGATAGTAALGRGHPLRIACLTSHVPRGHETLCSRRPSLSIPGHARHCWRWSVAAGKWAAGMLTPRCGACQGPGHHGGRGRRIPLHAAGVPKQSPRVRLLRSARGKWAPLAIQLPLESPRRMMLAGAAAPPPGRRTDAACYPTRVLQAPALWYRGRGCALWPWLFRRIGQPARWHGSTEQASRASPQCALTRLPCTPRACSLAAHPTL